MPGSLRPTGRSVGSVVAGRLALALSRSPSSNRHECRSWRMAVIALLTRDIPYSNEYMESTTGVLTSRSLQQQDLAASHDNPRHRAHAVRDHAISENARWSSALAHGTGRACRYARRGPARTGLRA